VVLECVLQRRLELLKLEGNGLAPSEIVKDLSVKYGVSERVVYLDLETRATWQPLVQETREALLKVYNRHEQLYRKAVVAYMQAGSDRAKLASLNALRKINFDLAVLAGIKFQKPVDAEETVITWEDPKASEKA
jgi:hypothetical protein